MLLSFAFSKITVLLAFIGATSQIYLIFVVPILLYVKAFELKGMQKAFYYTIMTLFSLIGVLYLVVFVWKQLTVYLDSPLVTTVNN